ncbi:MAG TPA: DUF1810 domain-containing protein [Amaricoccus sp.]|uniref:DUF1810 domain-containing protein n=1 Tax=Amaricoccus sp. TaxID=1872485 RepID=UPI001E15D759|nr:DUF1810 domain-containing protein [Amaricoccus sp.]MCB1374380.1 DUF1810 domain-containing protein [Paracoccaceae bacterium]MCC0068074.1 DUF1810 domain-containing protein [Rhodovulum sp.]MCB1404005.1 DUF1810 domain-containing protein [Paracoccaceae bacterium]HPG22354.1 DUF1810 domain-containing protein [Amaricoccus sp.]HRW15730.1 DUF1810 domain-containing protein [Amaricoccus sp.]
MTTDLDRFVAAQDAVWPAVAAELAAGRKATHWMWFVFPQIAGLGRSATAIRFALADIGEARAYLAHPVLGPRLRDATRAMLHHAGTAPEAILGGIDALKFRSSMTLFAAADPDEPLFPAALATFYGGAPDPATLRLLGRG